MAIKLYIHSCMHLAMFSSNVSTSITYKVCYNSYNYVNDTDILQSTSSCWQRSKILK